MRSRNWATAGAIVASSLMLAAPPAIADAGVAPESNGSSVNAEFDQQLINPDNEQNYSLEFDDATEGEEAEQQLET